MSTYELMTASASETDSEETAKSDKRTYFPPAACGLKFKRIFFFFSGFENEKDCPEFSANLAATVDVE